MLDDSSGTQVMTAALAHDPESGAALVVANVWGDTTKAVAAGTAVADLLGAPEEGGEPVVNTVVGASDNFSRVVVAGDDPANTDAVVQEAMDVGRPPPEVMPEGWEVTPLDLGWVPRLGATRLAWYQGDEGDPADRMVGLGAVEGTLPGEAVMRQALPDEEAVTVRGHPAWSFETAGGRRAVIWQEAPGVVGVAYGEGIRLNELLHVAAQARWPDHFVVVTVPASTLPPGHGLDPDAAHAEPEVAAGDAASPPDPRCGAGAGSEGTSLTNGEAATVATGEVGLAGSDAPFRLRLWFANERSAVGRPLACWSLDMGTRLVAHGVYEITAQTPEAPPPDPVAAVVPVARTEAETVFIAAHAPGTAYAAEGYDLVSTPVEATAPQGLSFTFLRVDRDGRPTVVLEGLVPGSREPVSSGPLALD